MDHIQTKVSVVIGEHCDRLERFAADQLCEYIEKLFHIATSSQTRIQEQASAYFFIGNRDTNPVNRNTTESIELKKVSNEGILIQKEVIDGVPSIILGGGSPKSTLWAVYEFIERWGVRYLLSGDVLPKKSAFYLPEVDLVQEPLLPLRVWGFPHGLAVGPESWGFKDYCKVMDQLAKLKYNRVSVQFYQLYPFLHLEYKGIKRKSAGLFFNLHYPITEDMIGRDLFDDREEFWNPDLPINASYEEFIAAGELHVHRIMDYAHQRGLECVINPPVIEFPLEFEPILKDAVKMDSINNETIVPGPNTDVEDEDLKEFAEQIINLTIKTYPEADYLSLVMPEWRHWTGQAEYAWKMLNQKYGIDDICTYADVIAKAELRLSYPGGAERAKTEAKGDIVSLYYYDKLLSDKFAADHTSKASKKWIYMYVAEELYPILSKVLPEGSELLTYIDYTPSRVLRRNHVLKDMGTNKIPSTLNFTLNDDNVGVLPQINMRPLEDLLKQLLECGWAGFVTRYWTTSDQDACVSYISKAAWDSELKPYAAYKDYIRTTCGEECLEEMLGMFIELEAASKVLEWDGLGLSFPLPWMMSFNWDTKLQPDQYTEVSSCYQRALGWVYLAKDKTRNVQSVYIDYWIGRLEFAVHYMNTIEAVRLAACAQEINDVNRTRELVDIALEKAKKGIEAYARVARDQSDRAWIAVLNEYVYRYLMKKQAEFSKD
ncbi:hypothetical protein [Paenibacillus eucommiae]|uniref:Alpha glucuronidase N-terminal domain-containing protein n=1 Tax=Paenibacillus eucommiae TaxID=1355755 RepID=A0ABS4IVH2_9BACL|nr:hypothetical protein [Paenibacillus eucommiae]MBP1990836.1 hypothetical protein [Paenibacillus eucommiae]